MDLNLTKLGDTNYQTAVTRLVGGFANPIDAEIIGNRIYVIEYGGSQGLWEITFPATPATVTLSRPAMQTNGAFGFSVAGAPGLTYEITTSTNLLQWISLTNFIPTNSPFPFTDPAASNYPRRFYRAIQR